MTKNRPNPRVGIEETVATPKTTSFDDADALKRANEQFKNNSEALTEKVERIIHVVGDSMLKAGAQGADQKKLMAQNPELVKQFQTVLTQLQTSLREVNASLKNTKEAVNQLEQNVESVRKMQK